jgi:hypothetical protein
MNLRPGFDDRLPGRPVVRLALAHRWLGIVLWGLLLPAGDFAVGPASMRLSIDPPAPAGEGRAA